MDERELERTVGELRIRLEMLERSVSSRPPAAEVPAAPARTGISRFFDEKIVIAGIVSLVGVWATIYTNDKQMDQQAISSEKQFELETVRYQLGEYLEADGPEERITVLRVIRDTPHTSREMKTWATEQHDAQLKAFLESQKIVAVENAATALMAVKAEQNPGEAVTLTADEKRITEEAGERVVQEIKQKVEKGTKLPTARQRARTIWVEGYEEYNNGNVERAKELYTSSLAADSGYAPPINSLGRIQLDDKDSKTAELSFRRALKQDPEYAPAAYNLALSLAAQSRTDEAKQVLEKAVKIEPTYAKRAAVEAAVTEMASDPRAARNIPASK